MPSREKYQVSGNTVDELKISMNFALSRIMDRLDAIEGLRGSSDIGANDIAVKGNISVVGSDGTTVHSME